jgi:hypothetical protein
MSSLSSLQRVTNDIALCEQSSDHKVKREHYFIVKIELLDESKDMSDFAKKDIIAKHTMGENVVCVYVYRNTIYILFSSTDTKPHYLDGSHQDLCSHYASNASIFMKCHTRCNVIEFESRTKILIYFQTKVFENTKNSIRRLSKITIDKKETSSLTRKELIEALEKRSSIKWDQAQPADRFGIFYKYQVFPDGTRKFSTISEVFDTKSMDKYSSYIFGVVIVRGV